MKILYVTTISLTMNAFFKPHIEMLVKEGHQVEIACNDRELPVDDFYMSIGCRVHCVDFSRTPWAADNIRAYKQLKKVVAKGQYNIVHCHTPNAAVITRLVCRSFRKKCGLRVFYTAHGFHFYKGAPKLNWMVFYPIEKLCARFTDKLITINLEDYALAKCRMKAKEVLYVPGVGVDLSRFECVEVDRNAKRCEIGVPEDAVLLLSIGELNKNKNHKVVIEAIARLNNSKIHYAIAGIGHMHDSLLELAKTLGVTEQVHLLGYRNDVPELNRSADLFLFPSYREGLGVGAIEAMACGLPIITSNVHGINDYSMDGITGYKYAPDDVEGFSDAIKKLMENEQLRMMIAEQNKKNAGKYDLTCILDQLAEIYGL